MRRLKLWALVLALFVCPWGGLCELDGETAANADAYFLRLFTRSEAIGGGVGDGGHATAAGAWDGLSNLFWRSLQGIPARAWEDDVIHDASWLNNAAWLCSRFQ